MKAASAHHISISPTPKKRRRPKRRRPAATKTDLMFRKICQAIDQLTEAVADLVVQRNEEFDWLKSRCGVVTRTDLDATEERLLSAIQNLSRSDIKIMNTLEELLAEVEKDTTLDDSMITLLEGIKTQLDEILSGTRLPAAAQAKIDAMFAKLAANNAKVTAAIKAHTPAENPGNANTPVITSAADASGTVGTAFSHQLTADNSPTVFEAFSLPPGLTFDSSTGLISGTPTQAGEFLVDVSADNAHGVGESSTLTVTIA